MARATVAPPEPAPINSRTVLLIALPVAVSNATTPLQGAVDTAIIGDLADVAAQGAVGLGAELFSLLLASFNFLQIGVSGLSAQALGARAPERVALTLWRGCLIALAIAAVLITLQNVLLRLGLGIFEASQAVESLAANYFEIRIFAAPAELINYALLGWFAGQGLTKRLFQHQVFFAAVNIALSILFVKGFGWGVPGVAAGTLVAAYLAVAYGFWLARPRMRELVGPRFRPGWRRVLARAALARMLRLNRDLFIRTLLLVSAFAWMTRLGTLQDDVTLAANIVLFQFFIVSAFMLDGFAIAAESLVGQSIGARDPKRLDRAVWMTSLWSGALALCAALLFTVLSGAIIDLFTAAEETRARAREFAYWASLIPLVGFFAFQLDGVFIGATASREMRNAMILSALIYFPLSVMLLDWWGNHGVWAALWVWLLIRAASLAALYPAIRRRAVAPPVAEA